MRAASPAFRGRPWSVTDPARIIASAVETVETKHVMAWLKDYLAREKVEGFVVGLPVNLNGTATDATPNVLGFITDLKKRLPALFRNRIASSCIG